MTLIQDPLPGLEFYDDPLDESDHRPRHDEDGRHLYRHSCGDWHTWPAEDGLCRRYCGLTLASWDEDGGPLTFCDCPPVVE